MCVSTSSTSSTTVSAIPSTVPRRCCERWSRRGAWAARPVAASMSIAIETAGLSETQRQIVELAREFARTRIEPHAAEWDRTKHFPRDVIAELGRLGDDVAGKMLRPIPLRRVRLDPGARELARQLHDLALRLGEAGRLN